MLREWVRIKRDAALLEAELRFSPFPMWVRDIRSGRYTHQSAEHSHFFGLPENWLIGKTPWEAFTKPIADGYHATDVEIIKTRRMKQQMIAAEFGDGTLREVMTRKHPVVQGTKIVAVMGQCFETQPGAIGVRVPGVETAE